jgi:hypothetical protein
MDRKKGAYERLLGYDLYVIDCYVGSLHGSFNAEMLLTVTALTGVRGPSSASRQNRSALIPVWFHVSAVTLGWISLAYVWQPARALMPAGTVRDNSGRNRVYLDGRVTFTLFSFANRLSRQHTALII